MGERIVLYSARWLDVNGWGVWSGRDGDVTVGYVDGDIEDAWGECRTTLDICKVGVGAAVDETVGVVAGVVDSGDENNSAVIVECKDGGAKDWACGEGSRWPEYVRSVAWIILVNVVVVGQSGDIDIASFVVVTVDVGKIACFLELVAISLGYINVLARRDRVC